MNLTWPTTIVVDLDAKCLESGWRITECRCPSHRPDLHLIPTSRTITALPFSFGPFSSSAARA